MLIDAVCQVAYDRLGRIW